MSFRIVNISKNENTTARSRGAWGVYLYAPLYFLAAAFSCIAYINYSAIRYKNIYTEVTLKNKGFATFFSDILFK